MKLYIDGYEVEIKAKYVGVNHDIESKYNKRDAMAILNQISSWGYEAGELDAMRGLMAMSRNARKCANDIYDALDAEGYFKGVITAF